MVGDHGKVIAVDLQQQMLDMSAASGKGGVAAASSAQVRAGSARVDAEADFALVFAMLHEVPDQGRLLGEIHHCLKRGGKLLLAEPPIHVSGKKFASEVAVTEEVGFSDR